MVPDRRYTIQTVLYRCCPFSCNGPASCLTELQFRFMGSCRLGGMFDWSALVPPPPPQQATLYSLHTLSWFVSYRRLAPKSQHSPSAASVAQNTYIYRLQSSIRRLPNYWPPTPSPPSECVLPPHQRRGDTHSPAGEGVGGQYFGRPLTE